MVFLMTLWNRWGSFLTRKELSLEILKKNWKSYLMRALHTFLQALCGSLAVLDVENWQASIKIALIGAVLSTLKSLVAGVPEGAPAVSNDEEGDAEG